jgi:hypothetical protein
LKYYFYIKRYVIKIEINKDIISAKAALKQNENDAFRDYIKGIDSGLIDQQVNELYSVIEPKIACTECGACCRSLMINVTNEESVATAQFLNMETSVFNEKYIEKSSQGNLIMNTIPCHFLEGNQCSIYEHRFSDCRNFPNLNMPNFSQRLFATLIHYSICPIIYNVVEQLKIKTAFFNTEHRPSDI